MSYDPSHRTPPRQDRWPSATPQEAWPAYSGRGDYQQAAGYRGAHGGYGGYQGGGDDGYYQYGNGYAEPAAGYGPPWDGGYDDGYPGAAGDYAYPDEELEPLPSGALLIAPDTLREHAWRPGRSPVRDRDQPRGGLVVGSLTGFLAAAVAIGAATLAAAFVRPQASPVIAVGGAFIDHTPSAVKNFAVEHFGENDKTMLLLGMYVAIAVLAMVIGCLSRRNAAIGVGGIAAFGLFGAFVAITRPEAQPTDVIPSVVGGLAGVAAFAWLAYAAAPVAPARRGRGGRRRAR
jgi:hypothetical protein